MQANKESYDVELLTPGHLVAGSAGLLKLTRMSSLLVHPASVEPFQMPPHTRERVTLFFLSILEKA